MPPLPNCGAKVKHSFEISPIFAREITKIFSLTPRDAGIPPVGGVHQSPFSTGQSANGRAGDVITKRLTMNKILGIGNALVDALVQLPSDAALEALDLPKGSMQLIDHERYKRFGEVQAHYQPKLTTGGSACNTILAIAHLGGHAGLIGKVGDDDHGRFFARSFKQQGVETRLLTHATLPTGVASAFITPDGQRTFGTYLGAAGSLGPDDLRPEWFAGNAYLYIEGYLVQNHALISRAIQLAHEAGLRVCIDMASYNVVQADHAFFTEILPQTDIIFANEQEAAAYTGHSDPQANLEALAQLCEIAVVKVGKHGVMVRTGDEQLSCPARDVPRVVDTTAAGDYFSAGFLYAHAAGMNLMECARLGSLLSGHIIEVVGTALSPDVWRDIRATLPERH